MNTDRSNYALISVLYENRTRGLYTDIYFPIIKYAILRLYSETRGDEPFLSAQAVHEKIMELFGIMIPTMVIAMTVLKIERYHNGNIELTAMEKGNTFQIHSADYDEDDAEYEKKEREFELHQMELESEFKHFAEVEGTYDEGLTFLQFITDNTEAMLDYFNNNEEGAIEVKYATMVFFLQYLSEENKELYQVANQLFWSSIIAAFLQSERPESTNRSDYGNVEYFLDTSLVMGLLNLSTPEREECACEVRDITRAAGCQLKVHPVTIEEIKTILQSVETKGPYAFSSIASAFTRGGHNSNTIAKIRVNLIREIEKEGVVVFPAITTTERNDAIRKYRGKEVVKRLADSRAGKSELSYNSDNFREIHDIFMDDYIKERNKEKGGNVFFVTSNKELKDFCKELHPGADYMKSPGKLILELWMHSTKPSDISSCMLTETMARCMDLHRSKVMNKISEVSRKFKATKNEFSKEIYEDFLKQLYRRAKNVMTVVEGNPEALTIEELTRAVTKDTQHYEAVNSRQMKEKDELSLMVNDMMEDVEKKGQKINELTEALENKRMEYADSYRKVWSEKKKRNKAEEMVRQYKRRDELKKEQSVLESALMPVLNRGKFKLRKKVARLKLITGLICTVCVIVDVVKYNEGIEFNPDVFQWIILCYGVLNIIGFIVMLFRDELTPDFENLSDFNSAAHQILREKSAKVKVELDDIEQRIKEDDEYGEDATSFM